MQTVAVGRGVVAIGDLKVGDAVMSASGDGSIVSSRVYYIHDHKEESATVRVSHDKGMMELTPTHMVPIFSESCGESYCSEAVTVPAKDIQAGSRIYVASPEGTFVQVRILSMHITSYHMPRLSVSESWECLTMRGLYVASCRHDSGPGCVQLVASLAFPEAHMYCNHGRCLLSVAGFFSDVELNSVVSAQEDYRVVERQNVEVFKT